MTTEVEGTCVDVEDKTEADWAMEYAAENRRRVTAERRYAAAIYAAGGLIKSVDDLITAMFETNLQVKAPENLAFFKQAASLVMESFDMEIMANLCTIDAPWNKDQHSPELLDAICKPEDERTATDERLMREHFNAHVKFLEAMYKEAVKEWKMVCQQHDMHDIDDVKAGRRADFTMALMEQARRVKTQEKAKKSH
jgi:hypothetical protein